MNPAPEINSLLDLLDAARRLFTPSENSDLVKNRYSDLATWRRAASDFNKALKELATLDIDNKAIVFGKQTVGEQSEDDVAEFDKISKLAAAWAVETGMRPIDAVIIRRHIKAENGGGTRTWIEEKGPTDNVNYGGNA